MLDDLHLLVACTLAGAAGGLLAVTLSISSVAAAPAAADTISSVAAAPAAADTLAPSPAAPAVAHPEPSTCPPSAEPAAEAPALDIPAGAVQCPEDGRCVVARALVDEFFANPARLSRSARVMLAVQDGRQRGFKFYGMHADSLPRQLGLRNGDLVTAINGTAMTSLDAPMTLVTRLRQLGALDVELERRGAPHRLHIEIR